MTIAGEDRSGGTPEQADLEDWVERGELTHPVLADPTFAYSEDLMPTGAIPTFTVIAPGLEISAINSSDWQSSIEDLLPW